jgi:hypothetical protein
MDRLVFAIIATVLISFIIWITYRTKSAMFGTMFAFSLLILLAFYTFQWGPLGEFEVKGFSAQAKFIREKRQQVEADVGEIAAIKKEAAQILSSVRQLQERVAPRSLNPSPQLKAALSTDPRGQVYFIIEHSDTETLEYGTQWRNLLRETGWGDTGTIVTPQQIAPRQIPPGITLVIHKETPYALHFRDVLASNDIPVKVTFPGPADPSGLYDPSHEVVLLIGRRL